MRFKNFKIGLLKQEPDMDTDKANDALTTQIAGLEKQVNNKTKELEATEQELKDLSSKANVSKKAEDDSPKPHGPLGELSIEPMDQLQDMDEDMDINALTEESGEEVKLVEISAKVPAPAEATTPVGAGAPAAIDAKAESATKAAAEKEAEKDEDNSFSNLFGDEDEEENPLASLISSLPDVTTNELMDDLQEIKEIIQDRQ